MRQGPSRSKARQQPPQAQHSREGTASRELKPVIAGVVLKLAPGELPAARRGPRMRQDLRRLCSGSPPRHKTAPAASESPAQGRQFYADETPVPGDRRSSGELASGSLPFTFTGDRSSAPCSSWLGVQADMRPELRPGRSAIQSFEASPAAWRCSPRCGWPRPTSPSARLMSLRWRQPVLDPLGLVFLDGVQVDQRGELGPFLFERDQQFIERDVVHVATDVPGKAHRR